MKQVIICPDSFKGSISSIDGSRAIARGIKSIVNDIKVITLPIADGGEGTLDVLVDKNNYIDIPAHGTNDQSIIASYGIKDDTAIIEMSRASGLTITKKEDRDILHASTYGTGELIRDALNRGYMKILLTVGGSGTNDGGMGLFTALGGKFLDRDGNILKPCGINMSKIYDIDISDLDKNLYKSEITVATDVTNPLYGKMGATYIYGRQKGASDDDLKVLEEGMINYSNVVKRITGIDYSKVKGVGAGGGTPFPLVSFLGANIKSGIESVLNTLAFDSYLTPDTIVITGEGKVDEQSLYGKAIGGVLTHTKKYNVKTYVVAGLVSGDIKELKDKGAQEIFTLMEDPIDIEYSMSHAYDLLYEFGVKFANNYLK